MAPTGSNQVGRLAGSNIMKYGGKTLFGGLFALGAVSDIKGLTDNDRERKDQARAMASNLIDQGYTDYDAVMTLAQSNPQLESAFGDIGVSDYAKTTAGVGLQAGGIMALMGAGAKTGAAVGTAGGPMGIGAGAILGGASGLLSAAYQVDQQNKKAKRNEAFREQFTNELIQRGLA